MPEPIDRRVEYSSSAHAPSPEAISQAFVLPVYFCLRRPEQVGSRCTGKQLCRATLRATRSEAATTNFWALFQGLKGCIRRLVFKAVHNGDCWHFAVAHV